MTILLIEPANEEQTKKMCYEYGNYIKVVIDIQKGILAGGAAMHYDEERTLLEYGCKQQNLWGGGIDLSTGIITYDSMINIRPGQNNKNEIQSEAIKKKFDAILKKLLPYE